MLFRSVDDLGGEKIDIINYSEDPGKMISAALSPSKVEMVLINEAERSAMVVVPDYQLSLAIGKEGQNVRLAARLCGWKIDITSHSAWEEKEKAAKAASEASAQDDENYEEEYEDVELKSSDVKKMKKDELLDTAQQLGLEIPEKATVAMLKDLILAEIE